jgi:hypothetical protein
MTFLRPMNPACLPLSSRVFFKDLQKLIYHACPS